MYVYIQDLIFVTLSVGETGRRTGGLGAMAASAACIALVSPYNIDLQPRNVAGVPAYAISARVVQHVVVVKSSEVYLHYYYNINNTVCCTFTRWGCCNPVHIILYKHPRNALPPQHDNYTVVSVRYYIFIIHGEGFGTNIPAGDKYNNYYRSVLYLNVVNRNNVILYGP